jgi:hypothetical protein
VGADDNAEIMRRQLCRLHRVVDPFVALCANIALGAEWACPAMCLADRLHLVYETYGQLNADKSNAVLVCHAS